MNLWIRIGRLKRDFPIGSTVKWVKTPGSVYKNMEGQVGMVVQHTFGTPLVTGSWFFGPMVWVLFPANRKIGFTNIDGQIERI